MNGKVKLQDKRDRFSGKTKVNSSPESYPSQTKRQRMTKPARESYNLSVGQNLNSNQNLHRGREIKETHNLRKRPAKTGTTATSDPHLQGQGQAQENIHSSVPLNHGDSDAEFRLQKLIDERFTMLTELQASQTKLNKNILANFEVHSEDIAKLEKEQMVHKEDIQTLNDQMREVRYNQRQQIKCLNGLIKTRSQVRIGFEQNMERVQGQGQGVNDEETEEESTDDIMDSWDGSEDEEFDDDDDVEEVDEGQGHSLDEQDTLALSPINAPVDSSYFNMEFSPGETEPNGRKHLMAVHESKRQRHLDAMAKLQKTIETLSGTLNDTFSGFTTIDNSSGSSGYITSSCIPPVNEISEQVAQVIATVKKGVSAQVSCPCCNKSVAKSYLTRHVKSYCKNSPRLANAPGNCTEKTTAHARNIVDSGHNLLAPTTTTTAQTAREQRVLRRRI